MFTATSQVADRGGSWSFKCYQQYKHIWRYAYFIFSFKTRTFHYTCIVLVCLQLLFDQLYILSSSILGYGGSISCLRRTVQPWKGCFNPEPLHSWCDTFWNTRQSQTAQLAKGNACFHCSILSRPEYEVSLKRKVISLKITLRDVVFLFLLQTDFSNYEAILSFVNVGGVHWKLLVSSCYFIWNLFVLFWHNVHRFFLVCTSCHEGCVLAGPDG